MPKNKPKSAFYYFMLDFKERQQKKGIHYSNNDEANVDADPEWRNATPEIKAKYERIAKSKRQDYSNEKYTSTGIPLSMVEQQKREIQEAEEAEIQDIKNMIKLKAFNNKDILEEFFYVMDVNYFCKTDKHYVIGEFTLLRFSLLQGFRDLYREAINPGKIPFGYASDVKLGCQQFGLEMPSEDNPSDLFLMMANIKDYLRQSVPKDKEELPPIYTMPEKVAPIQDFIMQICDLCGEREKEFRIYRVDTLFFHLLNSICTGKNEGFPKESLALVQLRKDLFKYTPKLACDDHEQIDKSFECTSSRAQRWAYTILDSCCPVVGIELKPGVHVPLDYDIEGILTYKDLKKERPGPSVAGLMPASSCNTTLNDSLRDTSHASQCASSTVSEKPQPRKEKRSYAPMRMPQADYSSQIRPAPELTEDNFPTLSIGAGRGRGLAGKFNKMNLKK